MHKLLAVVGVIAAAGFATTGAFAGTASPTSLTGTVGPGFTITLKDAHGRVVKRLKPGVYTLKVRDVSPIHDFHHRGPGVNKTTTVAATGTTIWTMHLKAGHYTYVCDPHHTIMHGSFVVG